MALGSSYSVGTISVATGSKTVTGIGVAWVDAVEDDWIFQGTQLVGLVNTLDSTSQITLKDDYTGTTLTEAPYRLVRMSWKRFDPALTQQKLRELLLKLEGVGVFTFVVDDVPVPSIGENGQFALKLNDPNEPWRWWVKRDDVWVELGTPVGFNFRHDINDANYLAGTQYYMRDVVRYAGKLWYAKRPNVNVAPGTSTADWILFYPFPNEAGVSVTLDALGSEIQIGPAGDLVIPFNCIIRKVSLRADGIGDFQLDIWRKPFAEGIPTAADSICAAAKPTLAGQRSSIDVTLTGWTTSLNADDALLFNVESCAGITRVTVTLQVERVWANS